MTIANLKQSSPDSKLPRENWAKIEEAEKMYQIALELSPNHPQIQSNYDKLKENITKNNKKDKNEK